MSVGRCCVCGKIKWVKYRANTNMNGKKKNINSVSFPMCLDCYIKMVRSKNDKSSSKIE